MGTALELETILNYLKNTYGCEIFQHSESYNSFHVACFRKGSVYPIHKFIIYKWAESEFSPEVLTRINAYNLQEHPEWKVIKFEDITGEYVAI